MQRGSANISKPPHTNKAGANENERATGIEPAFTSPPLDDSLARGETDVEKSV